MKKSIGILGGMGPLATADLLRAIVTHTQAEKDRDHIRIYIDDNPNIPDRTAAILSGGEDPVPQMTDSLRKLEACGADCILMPCNTAHHFLPQLQAKTDTPFLSMLDTAAQVCAQRYPGQTAAVLATRGTLLTGLYERALATRDIQAILPDEDDRDTLMHIIYDVVKAGKPLGPERDNWQQVLDHLRRRGADYFVLGCTELPIAARELAVHGPFVDPTLELAKAAIRWCGYQVIGENQQNFNTNLSEKC